MSDKEMAHSGFASIPGEIAERLEVAERLREAATALAERALAFVAPPPRSRVNPILEADMEIELLARGVLALATAPTAPFGETLSAGDIALLMRLRSRPLTFVKLKATGKPPEVYTNPDGPEAAALIEHLARQVAILKATTAASQAPSGYERSECTKEHDHEG